VAASADLGAIHDLLDGPITPSARKLISKALESGWVHNRTSMVTRWAPHGEDKLGKPFFLSWHLDLRDDKWRWRFAGGMAANLQRLNLADAMLYLDHPEVIYPEPPPTTQADELNALQGWG
jgi:hypothetical protein